MTREYDEDPEVVADLQLRASSQYDSTRTRGKGVYEWRQPDLVATWPCRRPGCAQMVGVTQEAVDACETFDRQLERIGKPRIERSAIVFCETCDTELRRARSDKRRREVDGLAELIRELKGEPAPKQERERVLIEQIRIMHHPDVDGLVHAIRERRSGPKSKAPRGKL